MFETTGIPDKVEPSHHLQALTDLLAPRDGDSESSGDVNGQHLNQSLISLCSHVCRICHHANGINEALISPCSCKGSLAYVHISCLERWLNQTCRNHCELCSYRFNVIETPRYRWRESLRIWMNYPPNRQHAQSDLIVFILLTVVVVGLTVVCLLGMKYFIIEGRKIGISRLWTRGAICFFLAIVILGYCFTVYLLVKRIENYCTIFFVLFNKLPSLGLVDPSMELIIIVDSFTTTFLMFLMKEKSWRAKKVLELLQHLP